VFIEAKDDGDGGDNWTTGAIRAHCTSLTKWLTRQLIIWLSVHVDALQETLTLG